MIGFIWASIVYNRLPIIAYIKLWKTQAKYDWISTFNLNLKIIKIRQRGCKQGQCSSKRFKNDSLVSNVYPYGGFIYVNFV